MIYFIICILCYLIGSIPVAFLIVKRRAGLDIRNEGSGNVGTLNSFEVTESRAVGITVLLLDLMKGLIPAIILINYFDLSVNELIIPFSLIVLGHNFPVWLEFKGGRGLAPAAGIILVLNYLALITWCIIFIAVFQITRKVHIGNIAATILLPFIVLMFGDIYSNFTSIPGTPMGLFFAIFIICGLVMVKHIQPLKALISDFKQKK